MALKRPGEIIVGEYDHRHGNRGTGYGLVLGYGPSRLDLVTPEGKDRGKYLDSPANGLFQLSTKLLSIEGHLIDLINRKNARILELQDLQKKGEANLELRQRMIQNQEKTIEEIKATLLMLLPNIDHIDTSPGQIAVGELRYHQEGKLLTFQQLSADQRAMAALIGDMMIRFIHDQGGKAFAEMQGIVLIDELENHLHVRWQYELPERLSRVFPKVQFIASTHSPIPLLGAPENALFWRIDHDEEGAIIVPLEMNPKQLQPNNVLSSPAFEFDGFLDKADRANQRLR